MPKRASNQNHHADEPTKRKTRNSNKGVIDKEKAPVQEKESVGFLQLPLKVFSVIAGHLDVESRAALELTHSICRKHMKATKKICPKTVEIREQYEEGMLVMITYESPQVNSVEPQTFVRKGFWKFIHSKTSQPGTYFTYMDQPKIFMVGIIDDLVLQFLKYYLDNTDKACTTTLITNRDDILVKKLLEFDIFQRPMRLVFNLDMYVRPHSLRRTILDSMDKRSHVEIRDVTIGRKFNFMTNGFFDTHFFRTFPHIDIDMSHPPLIPDELIEKRGKYLRCSGFGQTSETINQKILQWINFDERRIEKFELYCCNRVIQNRYGLFKEIELMDSHGNRAKVKFDEDIHRLLRYKKAPLKPEVYYIHRSDGCWRTLTVSYQIVDPFEEKPILPFSARCFATISFEEAKKNK